MTSTAVPAARSALDGWLEAALFAIALSVLNVSYAFGHQIGAHPVAFIAYAMPIAALTLLMITGPGPDWRRIVLHPLSFAIGGAIISIEAIFYLLLERVTPTDGSLLVRLAIPTGILFGIVVVGRRPSLTTGLGALIVLSGIAVHVPAIQPSHLAAALALAVACGLMMSIRAFASEYHPWNRAASDVVGKMRVTGLVLLVTSGLGVAVLTIAMTLAAHGLWSGPAWLPTSEHFLHLPTYLLALFMGVVVLTAMQYLSFSAVVKIRAENFLAATVLVPPITLVFQITAVAIGILAPVPIDWRTLPAMAIVIAGVMLVVWGGRRPMLEPAPATVRVAVARPSEPAALASAPRGGSAVAAIVAATLLGLPYGTLYAFSVLLKPLEELLGVQRAELSVVFGLTAIGFTVGMNIAPLLFGRLSTAAIIALATVVNVIGLAISAMATGTLHLLVGYGCLFGIASGLAFTTYQQGINLVVRRNLGLVNGYVVSLLPAGAMIGAPLLSWATELWGVRVALMLLAATFAASGLAAVALIVVGRVRVHEPAVATESTAGTAATTGSGAAVEKSSRPGTASAPDASTAAGLARRRRSVFWKIFAIFFVAAAAGLLVLSQAAGIVVAYGGASALAVAGTTGITAAIAAARLGGGWLVDRLPVPHVMAGAMAVAMGGAIALTLWPGPWVAIGCLGLVGIGYGIISGSTAAAIGLYWERRDFGRMASRLYIAWCIAAVTLPVLAARLFDLTGGYGTAVVLAGLGNLVGVLVALTLPRVSGRG
jgi:drug/metabolite transporter (DMT)-like permease/MFS family permease